jgi:plasmid stabilization system protein ParE
LRDYYYHPAAEAEALEAAAYYESRLPGLAARFRLDLDAAVSFIRRHPEAAPIQRGNLRRQRLYRFPYSLLYALEGDEIHIYAVMHHRRRPGYWIPRLWKA